MFLLLLFLLGAFFITHTEAGKKLSSNIHIPATAETKKETALTKLNLHLAGLDKYLINKKFNREIIFYIDMSISSGKNRFFVYDMKKKKVLHSGLVTHGRCNQYWLDGRKYSNVTGSGCTSLGKYKIGGSYMGRFGLAFKLHGLDATNSHAYERYVVLHSHDCVPETEVVGEICQSDGCPTVSPGFLKTLNGLIKNSSKPVMLWIVQ